MTVCGAMCMHECMCTYIHGVINDHINAAQRMLHREEALISHFDIYTELAESAGRLLGSVMNKFINYVLTLVFQPSPNFMIQ